MIYISAFAKKHALVVAIFVAPLALLSQPSLRGPPLFLCWTPIERSFAWNCPILNRHLGCVPQRTLFRYETNSFRCMNVDRFTPKEKVWSHHGNEETPLSQFNG